MRENDNRIYLRFRDFDSHPDEVSSRLNLKPSKTGIKGQSYFIGPPHNKIEKKWQWNYWEYTFRKVSNQFINEILTEFFALIVLPKKDKIKQISDEGLCMVLIVQEYFDGYNPGLYCRFLSF